VTTELTNPQRRALVGLSERISGGSAYELQVGVNTLEALVRRGLANYTYDLGDMFFPRLRRFVITNMGREVVARGEA